MTVTIFKDNRSPSPFGTIKIGGVAQNLTGLTTKFRMRLEGASSLTVDGAATVVATASTLVGNVSLPDRVLTVVTTAGFLPSGSLLVGTQIVDYDEISGNSFLGCEGGAGAVASGAAVAQLGGVTYALAAPDVATVGEYNAWWNVLISAGREQDTPEFEVQIIQHAPSQRGLCTLEDIQAYVPGYIAHSDHATDAVLRELIGAISTEFTNELNRDVMPVVPNPSARIFDLSAWEAAERKVFVGDLANTTGMTVAITQIDGTAVANFSMPNAAVVALPRNRQEWQPYSDLWFPAGLTNSPTLVEGYVVTVTGNWGFQSVPDDLETACIRVVLMRYLGNPANSGTSLSDSLLASGFDISAAFASSRATLESYMFVTIA